MLHAAVGLTVAAMPALAAAQVSGNWLPDADGVWSSGSNWSGGASPNGGGIATFPLFAYSTSGHTVSLDVPISLAGVTFSSPYAFTIGNSGGLLMLTGSAQVGAFDGPPALLSLPPAAHIIAATIAGSSGLNKTGPASLWLQGNNTFSGNVNISGGALIISNDAALGNAANSVNFSGNSSLTYTNPGFAPLATSRNFSLAGNAVAEIRNDAPMTISGQITGASTTALYKRGAGTLTLTGNSNTWTGSLGVLDGGYVVVSGPNGSIGSTTGIYLDGGIVADNSGTARTGRLTPDNLTSQGGTIKIIGNGSAATGEGPAFIRLFGGTSFIDIVGSGAATGLSTAHLDRIGRSTLFVRGDNLGAGSSGPNVTNFVIGNFSSIGLIGGGGGTGSTNISIMPWTLGNSTSGDTLNSGSNSLMTYSFLDGFRPLDLNSEYVTDINAAASDSNVRITSSQTNSSPRTVNSLVLNGVDLGGSTITVNSGAVAITTTGTNVSAPLAFGTREAVFHASSTGTISGVISGSNGLTKSAANTLVLSGANTYKGITTIVAGELRVQGDVPSDGVTPNPLGLSTSAIEMYGGSGAGLARLYGRGDANITISRPLSLNRIGTETVSATAAIGNRTVADPTGTFTYNGAIAINDGTLQFEFDTNPAGVINGAISGAGGITDALGSAQIVNGNNTFAGGTTIRAGSYFAGNDNAFGTGSIVFANTAAPSSANPFPGAIGAAGGGTRTIANPILNAAAGPDTVSGALGLVVAGSQPIALAGPMDLGGNPARYITVVNTADTTISGVISRGGLVKNGPGRLVLSGSNTYTGRTVAHSGTLVFARTETNSALQIDTAAVAELSAGGSKVLALRSLSIAGGPSAPSGTLDLHDNDMLVNAAPYANIAQQIRLARNNGAWNLPGITSSEARNAPNHNTTLGVLRGSEFRAVYGAAATFDGLPVASSDALVKYTWYGDSDLNGVVNFDDYVRTDNGFNNHLTGWLNGDFDLNGTINFDDYVLIDLAFNTQSGTLRQAQQWLSGGGEPLPDEPALTKLAAHAQEFGEGYVRSFLATVPEPNASALIGAAALSAATRRRSKNRRNFPLCALVGCEYISRH